MQEFLHVLALLDARVSWVVSKFFKLGWVLLLRLVVPRNVATAHEKDVTRLELHILFFRNLLQLRGWNGVATERVIWTPMLLRPCVMIK